MSREEYFKEGLKLNNNVGDSTKNFSDVGQSSWNKSKNLDVGNNSSDSEHGSDSDNESNSDDSEFIVNQDQIMNNV